jgi:hypothetical protein
LGCVLNVTPGIKRLFHVGTYRTNSKGEGTPRKLATATQPQFSRNVADSSRQLVSSLADAY